MKQIIVLLAISIAVFSCEMDIPDEIQPTEDTAFVDIQVSEDFDFSNVSEVDFTITSDQETIVYIYNGNPSNGGQLMYKAFTKGAVSVNQLMNIPVHLESVWVTAIGPNGQREEMDVPVNQGGSQILAFSGGGSGNTGGGSPNLTTDQETCANCDMYLDASSSNNITINNNSSVNTICIAAGESFSGRLNINKSGVEIRVCGQADLSNPGINMSGASTVLIVNGTVVTPQLNMNQSTCETVVNTSGVLNIASNFNFSGTVENYGSMTVDGNASTGGSSAELKNVGNLNVVGKINLNSNGVYNNYGTTTTTGDLALNSGIGNNYGTQDIGEDIQVNEEFNNYGTTNVAQKCQVNGSATLTNECGLYVGTDLIVNNLLFNYGFIEATDETRINGGGIVTLDNGLLDTKDITINGTMTGTSTGRADIAANTSINGLVGGDIVFCDETGIESLNGSIAGSVNQDCNASYPTVACDGSDNDGDGVNNGGDDFPNIPDQTFSSFYPAENVFGTFMFEDLFPNKGDYDFNDFVTQYQFETITNASNQIVQLKARFIVQAVGAANVNGFGFTLENVSPNVIFSVEGLPYNTANSSSANIGGNGTEVNQNSATFIVFDNINNFMGLSPGARYNVYDNQTTAGNPGQVELTITFTQPLNSIGAAPFNPFIYVGQNRGKEIHLKGYSPSDLADYSYFNTGDDNTNFGNGTTYQTNNAHPWGLDIPSPIQHMEEGIDFVTGYTFFLEYAESNGSNNTDWYTNPVKRNSSVLRPSVQ